MVKQFFIIAFSLVYMISVKAQLSKKSDLFIELKKQDSIFFKRSFNQCDLTYLKTHITDDLKFYHDKGGFQDKQLFFENIKKNICGATDRKPIRKLEEESLTVYPLYTNETLYGAIQSGVHHFYLRENGKEDFWTGTAKFTSVWVIEDNRWKLSEVLSYDHTDPVPKTERIQPIEKLLKDNDVPALGLGIIKNGKLTKVKVYGTLNKKFIAPYNTIFKVASLTKPIVALTVMKLIDEGLLDLDEPLYPYWIDPDLRDDKRYKKLTPRLVLSHQTGFPNWRYLTQSNILAFQHDPGAAYQYSGEGFEYLRKAIENKLGRTIEDLTQELVFKPSGMTDTRFWWDSGMDASRYAHNFNENGEEIELTTYDEANAAANLLTTVEDYGNFLAYMINGAELSEELFVELQKHQVVLKKNDFFGLGWEILTGFSTDESVLIHTGKDSGVSSLAVLFPKSGNAYLIFTNGDNNDALYQEILTKHLYLGDELWNRR